MTPGTGATWMMLLAGLAGNAAAQTPARSRLWAESGLGTGTMRIGCTGCDEVTIGYGTSSFLRLGGTISRRVLMGLEVFAFNDKSVVVPIGTPQAVDAENAAISAVVLWYPGSGAVFLRGGLGLARGTFTVTPPTGPAITTTNEGSALSAGVGLDVPLWSWFAVTANLASYVSAIGDVRLPGGVIDDVIATTYHASIGFTIR